MRPARREPGCRVGCERRARQDKSKCGRNCRAVFPGTPHVHMIMVGAMVGVIIISMYLPMFRLLSLIK